VSDTRSGDEKAARTLAGWGDPAFEDRGLPSPDEYADLGGQRLDSPEYVDGPLSRAVREWGSYLATLPHDVFTKCPPDGEQCSWCRSGGFNAMAARRREREARKEAGQ
jgi:hypothetical protein